MALICEKMMAGSIFKKWCPQMRTSVFQRTSIQHSAPKFSRSFSHDKQKYRWEHYDHHKTIREQNKHNKDSHKNQDEKGTVIELTINPIGTEEESMASYVGVCARIIKNHDLNHEIHAMGTVMEGSVNECFDAVKDCIEACLRRAPRIMVNIRADVRPGAENRLHKKKHRIIEMVQRIEDNNVSDRPGC